MPLRDVLFLILALACTLFGINGSVNKARPAVEIGGVVR